MRYAAWVIMVAVVLGGVACVAEEMPENTSEIKTLTVDQAKAVAQHKGWLFLNGLTTLSDEAAKALSQHKGYLALSGLTTLSDETAKALSQHKGYLSAVASLRVRERTAWSTSRRLSFSTGSPTLCRRRGSTGIAITEYSRRITS